MIFRPELAQKVLDGRKTVTRRRASPNPASPWYRGRCRFEVGREYSVQPGRGKPGVGRIRVVGVTLESLGGAITVHREPHREGFESAREFIRAWEAINGSWDPNELVWRVQFERVITGRSDV